MGGILLFSLATPALAQDSAVLERLEALEDRLDALQSENEQLRAQLEDMRGVKTAQGDVVVAATDAQVPAAAAQAEIPGTARVATTAGSAGPVDVVTEADDPREMQVAGSENFVGTNAAYAYQMLDHAENVNTKPLVQLAALQSGELTDRVTLSGGITAIANYQWATVDSKFGYLMRHPTSANQLGDNVSEVVLHSANLALTARLLPNVTGYAELLYDPEQSFGQGTITALTRNQIQLRRGWVMFGNLDQLPVYALVGKMDTPFGLNDTVNPFTNSTNWHAFAGLAYGGQVGFVSGGLHVRGMIIQGGAQFRSANVPVLGTSVPSRANNFAVDARYTIDLGGEGNALMAGASYQRGTAYCQDYPVTHFNPCQDNNPGIAAYGKLTYGPLTLMGEYAKTTKEWAGTAVPDPTNPLSVYDAVKPEAFTVGGRFGFGAESLTLQRREFALSAEFSKFISGEEGSPWRRQNQIVLGGSWFPAPNVNLFGEFIRVNGYVPLNFLSGGNFPDGSTWSNQDADTNVILAGAQVAF
ncbi:hypothetical protein VM77_10500 [Citromicrobium sp. JL31]|nr:hypothetical protein WG74_03150 [Citromicrobium sp. JL477]KPM16703.1 hypothetical protein VM77_10500 [Citromicrobium sp. JL31]KPM19150.1 hypothetical protein VO58_00180 [Citromicrobium sp. JL1351]KPM30104.1 hypothetical protein VO57_00180 [Citromicrobium sp. JL2201]